MGFLPCYQHGCWFTHGHSCYCSQYESTAAIFSSQSALCPFFFHLVIFCTHKGIPTGAWYVTLHINTGRREVNIRQFGSGKLFFSCIFGQFGEAGKWCLVCDPAHENQTTRSQHTPVWLKEMVFLMYIC